MEEKVSELNDLDNLLVVNHSVSIANIVKDRIKVSVDLWNNFEMKEIMLRLKSRQVWLRDWDYNSRVFHNSLKNGYMRNFIKMVESSSGILEGVT